MPSVALKAKSPLQFTEPLQFPTRPTHTSHPSLPCPRPCSTLSTAETPRDDPATDRPKRRSVDLWTEREETPQVRKKSVQLRQDLGLLEGMGVKTGAGVPSELVIFRDRRKSNQCLSTMDLWGTAHARSAMRTMGLDSAFRAIEDRDKRMSIVIESTPTPRFSSRMVDDLTFMKILNKPMVRSCSSMQISTTAGLAGKQSANRRARKIRNIMESCDQLKLDSYHLRQTLTPLEEIQARRRRRLLLRMQRDFKR